MTHAAERYNGLSRALHWLSALIIFTLIMMGWYMAGLDKNDPLRLSAYGLHKSLGVVTVLLLAARLGWLRLRPAPALPSVFAAKEKRIITGIQSLLYLLLLLVPVSGYVMSTAAGHPVPFFSLFEVPALISESKALAGFSHEAHAILGYAVLALVALHMAGAVKHRLANKGGEADVLARML